ncbi:hypothetical protein [Streptomyces sp. NPDC056165]|uniref:hypothetical protein n=1 Tax=Streptomyces sp. NPDC056165 TaxID=3345733 RepID=UPI0035DDBEDE
MTDVDAGSGDRLALAVLAQYRMATTEQMHLILNPQVRSSRPGAGWPSCARRGWLTGSPCPRGVG